MDYAPHTADDVRAMLDVLELPDLDALFAMVPEEQRAPADLGLAPGVSEAEVLRAAAALARRNRTVDDAVCFLGGGVYDHYVPGAGAVRSPGAPSSAPPTRRTSRR